jgi:ADP-ribose pyrophosphatase YjhB (NUDIX family)
VPRSLHELLLWLWRWLPLTERGRFALERLLNAKYVVGVHAIVVDDQGRILLAHHTYRHQFAWGIPGGWLSRDEDPAEAVVRELREETGLTFVTPGLLGVRRTRGRPSALTLIYAGRAQGTFRRSAEVDEVRWLAPDALPGEIGHRYREWIERAIDAVRAT